MSISLISYKELTKVRHSLWFVCTRESCCLGRAWSRYGPGYFLSMPWKPLFLNSSNFGRHLTGKAVESAAFVSHRLQNSESLFKFSLRWIQAKNARRILRERKELLSMCNNKRQMIVCPESGRKIGMKNIPFWYSWRSNCVHDSKGK